MTAGRRPRCRPITDDAGRTIGFARSAGPVTDQDRAIVAAFVAELTRLAAERAATLPADQTDT